MTSSWLSEPPFTPMRTGLPLSRATLQMVENCSSRRCPAPTLPGLMRYLSSCLAHSGCLVSRTWPEIKKRLLDVGCRAPIIGDFHYNGHVLLTKHPECAKQLDKYRINPDAWSAGRGRC